MTNSKSTKRALFSSVVALLLCFTMLLGTTFAWFTDSAASGSNVITAGNLDIVVEYTLDGENWDGLDGADDLFQKGLWEPGHTEVVALRIKNNGSLALKYAANLNIVSETVGKTKDGANIVLSDILTVDSIIMDTGAMGDVLLDVAFSDEDTLQYTNTDSFKNAKVLGSDELLLPGASKYLIVKQDMAETVTNEANHNGTDIPTINFGINVLATQFTHEKDSFGDQYDKDASTDDVKIEKTVNIDAVAGSIETVTSDAGEAVTVKGNGGTLTVSGAAINTKGGDLSITDLKVNAGTPGDYSVIISGGTADLTNVDVQSAGGGVGVVGGAKVDFAGDVDVSTSSTSGRYNFYVMGEGSELTITDGVYSFSKTLNQKRAYIYVGSGATVYVKGGTFGEASTRDGYTAGIMGDGTVIITGGTFGFDPSTWVADGYGVTETNGTWSVSAQ